MIRYVEQADRAYAISGDVYRVQRRPAHAQLIINDDYSGIRVLDARTGDSQFQAGFTRGYDSSGIIDAWCLREDGNAMLAINLENATASWLSLNGGPSYDLAWPSSRLLQDLRYLWEGDTFWVTAGKSYGFYTVEWQGGAPVLVEGRGIDARKAHRRWRKVVDSLPSYECNVLKVESDLSQMLYHDFSQRPGRIGVVSWRPLDDEDEESVIGDLWSAPAPAEVPALAFVGGHMFVMQEYEVRSLNKRGETESVYPAPEGSQNVGLDTVPAYGNDPAALIVVSSSLGDATRCRASVYHLAGETDAGR